MRFLLSALLAAVTLGACRTDIVAPDPAVALHIGAAPDGRPLALQLGATWQFQAVRVRADSSSVGEPVAETWSSADTAVAVVDASGTVTIRCVGFARVGATYVDGGRVLQGSIDIPVTTTGGPRCAAR